MEQPNFAPHSEEVARDLLGSHHCFGVYKSFTQDNVTFEEIETGPLKYLQDMTEDHFNDIFKYLGFSPAKRKNAIDNFNSLNGFMQFIANYGWFKSYPKAKALGYDVEFTMPIKK